MISDRPTRELPAPVKRRNRRGASKKRRRGRSLHCEHLERRELLAADGLMVTELMAVNNATSADSPGGLDQFGRSSDWIEIFNPTDAAVSLEGWHLSDDAGDKAKWTFPDVTIDRGEFLVVFASGRDITDPSQPLHTSFRLSSEGEYLGLIKPDMSVAQDFGEGFPEQFSGISYGVGADSGPALDDDLSLTYYVPTASDADLAVTAGWAAIGFDDASWKKADGAAISQGVGYALADSLNVLDGHFATNVEADAFLKNGSLWIRQEFQVDDPATFDGLLLDIQYDDGLVAYLNGTKVAEINQPEQLTWNAEAEVPRRPRRTTEDALTPVQFDLGSFTNVLVPGKNVLAIHALNDTSFDQELFSRATLTRITVSSEVSESSIGYLAQPTPGSANRQLRGGAVEFSETSKLFTDPIELALSSSIPGQAIHYTTDGSPPTVSSPQYTGPIPITETTEVWAAAFAADGTPGPAVHGGYTHLAEDVTEFSSDLPIVVLDGLGSRRPSGGRFTAAQLTVIEPDSETGRTAIVGEQRLSTRAGLKTRGSSTSGNPKLNLAVELWDDNGQDKDLPLLGMPADSDWVFYAPYNFDRTAGVRNSFFYELGNQMGIYSPRTRFVEVFHNLDGGDLERNDLTGIYVIIEKIKVGEDRVNIQKMTAEDTTEPNVSGGWLWKIDRPDPGDRGIRVGSQTVLFVDPKEAEVKAVPEQLDWAQKYLNDLTRTISNSNTTWEEITQAIDLDSWINNAIVNNVGWNVDVFRLSGYFHKDRNGPLVQGPLWDCDRCMGSEDGRDTNPRTWTSALFTFNLWWADLVRKQPDFMQAYIDRWFEQRSDVLSTGNVLAIVDAFASQVAEAQVRNFERWPAVRPNSNNRFDPNSEATWESEVRHLKGWLTARLEWTDSRFVAPAVMQPAGGRFEPDKEIVLSAESGSIYYTLDGTDPRLSGGDISPSAILYEGPFKLTQPATIMYRVRDDSVRINVVPRNSGGKDGSPWSAPNSAAFAEEALANAGNLRITEINYNPPEATPGELQSLGVDEINNDEFEFLEVMNIGAEPINLEGAQLVLVDAFDGREGVEFTFDAQMLAPRQRIVVVENVEAFRARFGNGVTIAKGSSGRGNAVSGQYRGNLANGGESVKLVDRFGQLIQRLAYGDAGDWPARADGGGSSLELTNLSGDSSDPTHWRASLEFGGSPGASGEEQANRIVVSEVLTNTDPPQSDQIELHNVTNQDIDITGWFISDTDREPRKFKIETPTIVPAGGYVVLSEQQLGFGLDGARGGELFLLETDPDGRPRRFANHAQFGNTQANVSLGRWPDDSGDFWPMAETTLGGPNSGIRPGDVIITEVHYSPLDPDGAGRQKPDSLEFIELLNQTSDPIDLGGWRLTNDAGGTPNIEFDPGTVINPGETVVLVPFDPSAGTAAAVFRFFYGMDDSVPLVGDFRERRRGLSDEGAQLRLERPIAAPADDPDFTPYVWVDNLSYTPAAPWPAEVIGNGNSLTRISGQEPGFLPLNWRAAAASPGSVELTVRIVGDSNEDGRFDQADTVLALQGGKYLTAQPASFAEGDWNGDGVFDQKDIIVALQSGNYLTPGLAAIPGRALPAAKSAARLLAVDGVFSDAHGPLDAF